MDEVIPDLGVLGCYLDVIIFGAVDVKNNAPLVTTGGAITANYTFAQRDALIRHYELVKDILAVLNSVLDDAFLKWMTTMDETYSWIESNCFFILGSYGYYQKLTVQNGDTVRQA